MAMIALAVYVVIMLVAVALAYFRPATAIAFVICTYGLEQWLQSQSVFFIQHHALLNYSSAALASLAVAFKLFRREKVLRGHSKITWLSWSLYAFALLSYLWSVSPRDTLEQWRTAAPYIIVGTVIAPLLVSNLRDVRSLVQPLLLLGTLVLALLMFTSEWKVREIVLAARLPTSQGGETFGGNALAVGSLGGSIALVALVANFSGFGRFWQLARFPVVALGLAVAIRGGSRGQVLAALICATLFVPLARRVGSIKGIVTTIITILVVAALADWGIQQFAVGRRWESGAFAADTGLRFQESAKLLAYWGARPEYWLIGIGSSGSFKDTICGFYPHVVPAEVLGEEGLIGFALLASVWALAFRAVFRIYRVVVDDPIARSSVAALGALMTFDIILCCKQGSLIGGGTLLLFPILLGRVEASLRVPELTLVLPDEDARLNDDAYQDVDERITYGVPVRR